MLSKFCLLCSVPGNGNWLGGLFARWGRTDIRDEFKGMTHDENTEKVAKLQSLFKLLVKEDSFSRAMFTWTKTIRLKGTFVFFKSL